MIDKCPVCSRELKLTWHHLIPKTLHSTKWYKKNFTNDELNSGVMVCRLCHDAIHKFFDEKELGREFNTLEKLLDNEKIKAHAKWASKQK